MKKILYCLIAIPFATLAQNNVGIGTNTPNAKALLHINLGDSISKGFLVTGEYSQYSTIPNMGTGTRLMFFPGRAAFRAGGSEMNSWDNLNVGAYSVAFGLGCKASGTHSFANGFLSTASGYYSTVFGNTNLASNYYSTSIGSQNKSIGWYSTTIGNMNVASGIYSTVFGEGGVAKGYSSFVVGKYNDSLQTIDEYSSAIALTPLFMVGNGTISTRSNALAVFYSGRTHIGTSETNDGSLNSNALLFGAMGSGEGIASKRTAGGNQYGLDFFTFNQKRMSITATGNVGIGTDVAAHALDIRTNSVFGGKAQLLLYETENDYARMKFQNTTSTNYWDVAGLTSTTTANARLNFNYSTLGDVLSLHGNGNAVLAGTLTQNSDMRLKKDMQPLQSSLGKLLQLTGYSYHWKDIARSQQEQIGVLAQEVQQVLPQLVEADNAGTLSVNYSGLVPVLINAIKEQQQQIEALTKKLQSIEKK